MEKLTVDSDEQFLSDCHWPQYEMPVRAQDLSSKNSFRCMMGIRKSIFEKQVQSGRICGKFLHVPVSFCVTLQHKTSTEVFKKSKTPRLAIFTN